MAFSTFNSATILLLVIASVSCDEKEQFDNGSYVNFIVVGATGSLAQKYLWQGMYDLREEIDQRNNNNNYGDPNTKLFIYGGARAEEAKGGDALRHILDTKVDYVNEESMETFKSSVQYVQLKTCSHYEALCRDTLHRKLATRKDGDTAGYCSADGDCHQEFHFLEDQHRRESGRIFYLAVPPYSYSDVAHCIHRVCRPPPDSNSWLRLVLEKPFGTNVDTVTSLVSSLKEEFSEDEIFLVDHYLGKPAVQNILMFRHRNRHWLEPLLNGNHVERIEIIIKEKEDVEGRLNYYDTYGVFLDVLQNHAMEMLSLAAMDLPPSLDDSLAIRRQKLRFLRSVLPIQPDHVVAGQYLDYVAHGRKEFGKDDFDSRIPTFGAAVIRVPSARWRGVPLILLSGKALDAKVSLVRITFKNTTLHLSESHSIDGHPTSGAICIFASSPQSTVPWMSVTNGVSGKQSVVTDWEEFTSSEVDDSHRKFRFVGRDRAYSTVVSDVYAGKRDSFVSMEQLTASWIIWDDHLRVSHVVKPKLYQRGSMDDLAITWTPTGLHFLHGHHSVIQNEPDVPEHLDIKLCNAETASVIVKPLNQLVETVVRDLRTEVTLTGEDFHLAIPGGRTPLPIFHRLAHDDEHFPWRRIHFWFTDERCVPLSHPMSNFHNAEQHLFKHLQMSYLNVHPMPVDLASGLCHTNDKGDALYADQLHKHLGANNSLDVVILGVGDDGHVASLFPQTDSDSLSLAANCDTVLGLDDNAGGNMVTMSEAITGDVKYRMSLTFDAIAAAKNVFLVIWGKSKHGVVEELRSGHLPSKRFPVKSVHAARKVRIYVDHDAYLG